MTRQREDYASGLLLDVISITSAAMVAEAEGYTVDGDVDGGGPADVLVLGKCWTPVFDRPRRGFVMCS
jgi:hypothetical protein